MPNAELHSIAQHFFSPAEQAHLASLPTDQQHQAFFECWTRKESVIKATGEGVSRPLDSFEVAFGPGTSPKLLRLDHNRSPTWQMASFEPAPGYIGALASPHPWHDLQLRTLPPATAKTD
jgi:4'-phosphopantetheinyl transferase